MLGSPSTENVNGAKNGGNEKGKPVRIQVSNLAIRDLNPLCLNMTREMAWFSKVSTDRYLPGEGTESHTGLLRVVPRQLNGEGTSSDSKSNEAGKPEEHGQDVQTQDDEAVGKVLSKAGGQHLPGYDEQTPNGHKDHKGDLRGHNMVGEAKAIDKAAILPEVGHY